jgi:hypothetical protein
LKNGGLGWVGQQGEAICVTFLLDEKIKSNTRWERKMTGQKTSPAVA